MEHCQFCGSDIPNRAQFCGYCGRVTSDVKDTPTHPNGYPAALAQLDDKPTFINSASHPDLGGRPTIPSGQPWSNQYSTQPGDEEEEERRRGMLLGLPLLGMLGDGQPPAGSLPLVKGTPQVGGVPMVPGTPSTPGGASAAPVFPGAAPATPTSLASSAATKAQLPHAGPWSPPHPSTPAPGSWTPPDPSPPDTPPTGPGCALTAVILAIVTLIIIGSIGALFIGLPPTISLTGNSDVTAGGVLQLHGSNFLPGSNITFTLDNGLPLLSASRGNATGVTSSNTGSATQMIVARQLEALASSSSSLSARSNGTFDVTIPVMSSWSSGQHTIRAKEGITLRSAVLNFTVKSQAALLQLKTPSLDFGKLAVGSKAVLSVALGNSGKQQLSWTAQTGGTTWLSLQPGAGTIQAGETQQFIYVTADTNHLKVGSYSATINITSNGGSAQVPVTLIVTAPPSHQPCRSQTPSPAGVTFNANVGSNPAAQTFTIGITGTCAGGVTLTPTANVSAGTGWLAVTPPSATITHGSATFTVNVTSANLSAGSYTGSISLAAAISNTAIDGSPQTVGVMLNVKTVPPALSVNPSSLAFNLLHGDGASQQPLTISNTGGSPLNWTATLDARAPSFVSLATGSGTNLAGGANVNVNVNVNPSGATPGSYATSVTISGTDPVTGKDVAGSPVTLSITITITAQPSMQLSRTSITFTPPSCQYTDKTTITLTNSGGGTLTWTIGTPVDATGAPATWLTVSPGQGSGDATLTFAVDGTKLNVEKTYTATVTITPSTGNPQTVSVSFTVPSCIT